MKYVSHLFVLFLVAAIQCHNVVDLTSSNFADKVLKSEGVWMVAFVAPWCGHCQRLEPEYEKASDALGGVVNLGRINCDNEKALAQQYGIQGFPTIKIFNHGKDKKRNPEDYQGARQGKGIVDLLMNKFNSLPDPVAKITSQDDLSTLLNNTGTKALLFTSKASNPSLFKSLAVELRDVQFGYVPNSNSDIKSQYNVDKEPSVVIIPGENQGAIKFDGALKKYPLYEFIQKHTSKQQPKATTPVDTTYKPKPKQQPKVAKVWDVETTSQLKTVCDRMCLIGLPETATQKEAFEAMAQAYVADNDKLKFATVRSQHVIQKKFDVEPSVDDGVVPVIVIRGNKLKFVAKHVTLSNYGSFLDRVLFGEQSMSKFDEFPQVEGEAQSDEL
ncbi:protein disulfide-isomerase [Acrasis kona]|uniref:Protein disulfide-isomerase n=1 Tax=Acrasis kona TaxID=1008807 RepID=A0AAW2Z4P5_9EUKA